MNMGCKKKKIDGNSDALEPPSFPNVDVDGNISGSSSSFPYKEVNLFPEKYSMSLVHVASKNLVAIPPPSHVSKKTPIFLWRGIQILSFPLVMS